MSDYAVLHFAKRRNVVRQFRRNVEKRHIMQIPITSVPAQNPFSYIFNESDSLEESTQKLIKELPHIIQSVKDEFKDIKTVFSLMEKVICRLKQVEIIEGTSPRVFPISVEVQYSMESSESRFLKKFPELRS